MGWEHGLRLPVAADVDVAVDVDAAADVGPVTDVGPVADVGAAAGGDTTAALVAELVFVLDEHAPASMIAAQPSKIAAPRRRFITDSSIKTLKGVKEAGGASTLRFAAVLY